MALLHFYHIDIIILDSFSKNKTFCIEKRVKVWWYNSWLSQNTDVSLYSLIDFYIICYVCAVKSAEKYTDFTS